ncbi:thermonuclease family protein [Candidatus Saccharibacteria bacterium]|nr:thermonuclease family protein [Candidatus Saccharibacteria bacterium]
MSRRLRRRHVTWLSLAIALFLLIGQHYGWFDTFNDLVNSGNPGLYRVVSYADGDTITVDMNGHDEEIRFIGVDTPETHDPRKNVQCGGPAASVYTKKRISAYGKVRLQSDALSSNRDRYNRLLRYVYLPDGTLMNENLIQNGYGFAYTYFPFSKSAKFIKDEATAQAAKKGLWGYCKPTPNQYGGYTSNDL